jgi:hypothetical protein
MIVVSQEQRLIDKVAFKIGGGASSLLQNNNQMQAMWGGDASQNADLGSVG